MKYKTIKLLRVGNRCWVLTIKSFWFSKKKEYSLRLLKF